MILAGIPWAGIGKATSEVLKDPDKMDFVGYLILTVIGAAIISLILTLIAKFVFELDKDKTESTFIIITGGITLINIILYFTK